MTASQTDFPLHLFHHGENFKAYELMGAHPAKQGKKKEISAEFVKKIQPLVAFEKNIRFPPYI